MVAIVTMFVFSEVCSEKEETVFSVMRVKKLCMFHGTIHPVRRFGRCYSCMQNVI